MSDLFVGRQQVEHGIPGLVRNGLSQQELPVAVDQDYGHDAEQQTDEQ